MNPQGGLLLIDANKSPEEPGATFTGVARTGG
jgi:hypothetical protein